MKTLAIDLETFSDIDIAKSGLYKYAEHSEVLLFAYAYNDSPVRVVDLACGEELPDTVLRDLTAPDVLKTAFNAAFEMHVLAHWLDLQPDPAQWLCTMVQSYMLGLPGSLKDVGRVLGLPEDKQKMAIGKRLIQYFCKPCRPTKINGGRTRNRPSDAPDKWELFKTYNRQDVEAERAIRKKVGRFNPTPTERKLWCLDQKINDAGVRIDEELVDQAILLDARIKETVLQKAVQLTHMTNPNSNTQLLDWFEVQEGWRPETLDKKARAELLRKDGILPGTRQMLEYKQLLSKTSVKKYVAMRTAECRDGRIHGMLQFYGAARSGRWAGRLVQLQNLPQNHLEDLDDAREMVRAGDLDSLEIFYDNPSDVLSQLIRTAFIAGPGNRFIVADFSAIEARVIAWYADETWRLQAFANGKDIYCASASQMFGVPVVKHGINGELRQKGKVAELACIAEGQLVLTNHGEKPIQEVLLSDTVWDGENWVQHDGVVYKGKREVITYEGLTATPDHLVYVQGKEKPVHFGTAASRGLQLQTGLLPMNGTRKTKKLAANRSKTRVYDIRNAGRYHRFTVSGKLVHNCGYGGGVNALKAFGADNMGLTEAHMKDIVTKWRQSSPRIVRMWRDIENAVKAAVRHKGVRIKYRHGLEFYTRAGLLFIRLPSGRAIAYARPGIALETEYNRETLIYEGTTLSGGWGRCYTWGGKLVENIVQATARDCLAIAMLRLDEAGYKIVMHVHDEVILEMPYGRGSLEEAAGIMGQPIDWAPGLLLRADGYETPYYRKD
jgi:DNA polymerase|nr:MAG TPA: DNA polymerase I [Caudoviricetes sp.]